MDSKALDRICFAFRTRLKALQMQSGIARVALVGLIVMPASMVVDWWVHLPTIWRCVTLLLWAGGMGAVAWWTLLKPLAQGWSNQDVLNYVDSVAPPDQGMLLDLYELTQAQDKIQEAQSPTGKGLVDDAVDNLQPLVNQIRLGESLQRRRALRWVVAVAIVVGILGATMVTPGIGPYVQIGMERFFNPFSETYWPSRTQIAIEEPEGGWVVPQLESKEIVAWVTGEIPPQVTLEYTSASTSYPIKEKLTVKTIKETVANEDGTEGEKETYKVAYTFPEVREAITFRFAAGDFETVYKTIDIIERPFLTSVVANYRYPKYAGLPDRTVASGQLQGLEGTEVTLEMECNMKLKQAMFILREPGNPKPLLEEEMEFTDGDNKTFSRKFLLEKDSEYQIKLFEANGFSEAKPEVYEIRVTPDNPPEIEMTSPNNTQLSLTRNASVQVGFRARDDFGIAEMKFLTKLDDGEPKELSDRITGPIPQDGRNPPPVAFDWDLRKMGLPKEGSVKFWATVKDVNPTGRGKNATTEFEIRLVKPSEFHRKTIEGARKMVDEARIAWRNQLESWQKAQEWQAKGTGSPDDKIWEEMQDKQKKAIRAGVAADMHLRSIIDAYESNRMHLEFMAGRLGVIAKLMNELVENHHPNIDSALRKAIPRTDADAEPNRLKALRTGALGEKSKAGINTIQHQKMALLHLERILRKLFDWEDLQTTIITTTLLHEEQEELMNISKDIGARLIGKDILDLNEKDQDTLLTLGKKQRVQYDVETGLETQIQFLMEKAQIQKRATIKAAMQVAFGELRNRQVNRHLKKAADAIEKNQVATIIPDQEVALQALAVVKAGLEVAGKKVEPDPELTLAMEPSPVESFDEPKKKEVAENKTEAEETADVAEMSQDIDSLLKTLPEGQDAVSFAVQAAIKMLENVISRTRYLDKNSGKDEMPRFVKLKLGRLNEYQGNSEKALNYAFEASKDAAEPIKNALASAVLESQQSTALLAAHDTSEGTQQLQTDCRQFLLDLLQYIARGGKVAESVDKNKKGGGLDEFKRKYLYADKNLDTLVGVFDDVSHARLLAGDLAAKLTRFEKFPAKDGKRGEVETANRKRCAETMTKIAGLIGGLNGKLGTFTPPKFDEEKDKVEDIVERAKAAGLGDVLAAGIKNIAGDIASGGKDKALAEQLTPFVGQLSSAVNGLMDLMEERVQPKPAEVAAVSAEEQKQQAEERISAEDFAKSMSEKSIRERIEKDTRLPPEVRERMVRALSKDFTTFPERYKQLLAAYYSSFLGEEAAQ